MTSATGAAVVPFKIDIPQDELNDLYARLDQTRWPEKETVNDWSQGAPLAEVKKLVDYWRNKYDWRRCEAKLNSLPQFKTELDGLGIHFLHIRSSNPQAMPLLMTHGWPGSIIEFLKVIEPLTEPQNFGGKAEDAFHLVLPTLPGFGFSDKPSKNGWNIEKIAQQWDVLMKRLGYQEYVAQGGDWGSAITRIMGVQHPEGLKAIHSNLPLILPAPPYDNLSPEEAKMMEGVAHYQRWESGYSTEQMTRPQTLGYGLADSAVGQAAWIFEKYWPWTDCHGDPLNALTYDEMLDNIMMYWLTNSATSSSRIYWESFYGAFGAIPLQVPCGYSIFPKDLYISARSWAEKCTPQLIHWNVLEKGGHFAAWEQPELFVKELQDCFRHVR